MGNLEIAKRGFVLVGSLCVFTGAMSLDEGVISLILALVGLGFGVAAWGASKLQAQELEVE